MIDKSKIATEPIPQKHKGFKHQQEILDTTKSRPYYGLLWEMGIGKTKTIIDTIVHLYMTGEIDGALIVAPKGAYLNWINNELPIHMPDEIPNRTTFWKADWTNTERRIAEALIEARDNMLDIFVMNIEALSTGRGCEFAQRFIEGHYTLMAVDESSTIKNHKAIRTKNVLALGNMCDYRRIMSGTPMAQSPLDIYTQCEFLRKRLLGFDSFFMFKSYFAKVVKVDLGRRYFEKIVGYKNLDELTNLIAPFTSRITKEEVFDMPEKNFITHYVEWTPEQKKLYTQMKEEALIEFSKEDCVSSTSVLTTIMKLHQINCGHVKTDEGTTVRIPHNRTTELLNLLELMNGKVIIWAHFQDDIKQIVEALSREYGSESVVDYYGLTPDNIRPINIAKFKSTCRFLVTSPAVGGRSLTLTECWQNIYYSYDYNPEHWLQSQDRTHRYGQTKTVTYTIMMVPKTIDEKISKALEMKKHLSDEVLDRKRLQELFT